MINALKVILKVYITLCNICCFNNYKVIILKRIILFNFSIYIILTI